jgi:hypothetical protein
MSEPREWPVAEDPDEDTDWTLDDVDDDEVRADQVSGEPLVVFVHIQKTAGKTLRHILRRQYAGAGRSVHVPNFFAKPDLHWSAVDELVDRRPPGLEAAHGHMLFAPDRWPRGSRFVTILRDPVERTISHYYWLNERRGARSGWRSIDDALGHGAIRDNLQVRVLSGADPAGPVTSTMAEEAIAALDRFSAVGLTSRFDESLVLFGREFGWRTAAYERVNTTSSRVPREALRESSVKRIQEHNRYDQQLYAEAAERFDALLRAQPEDFQLEVDIVRAAVALTPLDARWPEQSIVLSTDGIDARALLVTSEASRLAAELDRQRLRAATRQIAHLQSRPSASGGDVDQGSDEALRTAMAQIDDLRSAQRGAKRKIARARKRLDADPDTLLTAPDSDDDADTTGPRKKKLKRPRDPNIQRKPKASRAQRPTRAT